MDAAIAGLLGAAIGSAASVLGLLVQHHHQTKRDRAKLAADLGLAEYNHNVEFARGVSGGGYVAPMASYVIFNARLLDLIAAGPVTADKVRSLIEERDDVLAAFPTGHRSPETPGSTSPAPRTQAHQGVARGSGQVGQQGRGGRIRCGVSASRPSGLPRAQNFPRLISVSANQRIQTGHRNRAVTLWRPPTRRAGTPSLQSANGPSSPGRTRRPFLAQKRCWAEISAVRKNLRMGDHSVMARRPLPG